MSFYTWLSEQSPYTQTICGTLFTWGLTAVGAALIFVLPLKAKGTSNLLDASLGFAAGVMLAASYWSLLSPALEKAEASVAEGLAEDEELAFGQKLMVVLPVAIGFLLGAAFVWIAGKYTSQFSLVDSILETNTASDSSESSSPASPSPKSSSKQSNQPTSSLGRYSVDQQLRRRKTQSTSADEALELKQSEDLTPAQKEKGLTGNPGTLSQESWSRMLALIVAITVHNIPEGLAVGVGFGATDFGNAFNLAVGIGIQNFPEGLAVSLPLAAAGQPKYKAFFWGQFSGFVEPIFGMLGCYFTAVSSVILPYALGFAAGAMVFVVMDDIIPDSCSRQNSALASKFSIVGFIVMMTMDVALG